MNGKRGPHKVPRMSEDTFDRETLRILQALADHPEPIRSCIVFRDGCQLVTPIGKERQGDRVLWRVKTR